MTVNELVEYLSGLQAHGLGDVLVVPDDNVDKPEEGIEYIDLATVQAVIEAAAIAKAEGR